MKTCHTMEIAISGLLPLLATSQMVVFNISQGIGQDPFTEAQGFEIRCKTDQYCFFHGDWSIRVAKGGNKEHVELDTRFPLFDEGYRWLTEDWNFWGIVCQAEDGNCNATCAAPPDACVCKTGTFVGAVFDRESAVDCPILETLPNANVPVPEDLIVYVSSAFEPERVALRCYGDFAVCQTIGFHSQTFLPVEDNVTWATDFGRCEDGDCLIFCDERCTCFDNVTDTSPGQVCTVNIPTDAPTQTPTTTVLPTMSPTTSGAGTSHLVTTLVFLLKNLLIDCYYFGLG